jgi:hypothetical protein
MTFKATALSDLCEQLRTTTGIHLAAGRSVADEKVTLFCKNTPLRDVMRQLSRPFGYTWVRSGKLGEYRYELLQELRTQLLEEELRTRDRHAALLALEREIERYRPYLHLSPDEAQARMAAASPEDRKLLERLSGVGWGPIQMYFRLSPQEQAALRSGRRLSFAEMPREGELPLPTDVARGALQALRDLRAVRRPSGDWFEIGDAASAPAGLPLTAVPEAKGSVYLTMGQGELGQFTLNGGSGFAMWFDGQVPNSGSIARGPYAVGVSPTAQAPRNRALNAKLARDPALRPRVTVRPQPSCGRDPSPSPSPERREEQPPPDPGSKATTADVLEALHRASGRPIVADYYTRLYEPAAVSVEERPLFDALNQLGDAMRMHWTKEGAWLQFRSATFYHDRLKEVPNRLLFRWAAARREHGELTLDDLIEISQLTDAQLLAESMAEGARDCFGLEEWDLAAGSLRPHLRFMTALNSEQRQWATSADGLVFSRMTLAQQQQFIALGLGDLANRIRSLEELAGATVRVDYTWPGWFQWGAPPAPKGSLRPQIGPWRVRERTREAALRAARRLDPQADAAQLVETTLDLRFIYLWSSGGQRSLRFVYPGGGEAHTPWD